MNTHSPDEAVNDNDEPPRSPITLTDLALASGIDEDELLQRFAEILSKREEQ